MAFPSVVSVTQTQHAASSSHSVDLPATVADGDLLIIIYTTRNNAGPQSTPSGWTEKLAPVGIGGTGGNIAVYAKVGEAADGGGSVSITIGAADGGASQVYRIQDWEGTLASLEIGTMSGTGSGSNPDPASVTASWGSEDNLFIAFCGMVDDGGTATAAPSSYTGLETIASGTGTNQSSSVASAHRELAAATDDPGTFTLTENEGWNAGTMVVRPEDSGPSAALTGTLASDATEGEIVAGGETLIITLTNDTWEATVGADNPITQAIIDGLDSAQAEATGWDAVVKAGLDFNDVTRDSDTQITVTLPAFASYDITATETITVTVPASALVTSTDPVVADTTFDVTPAASGGAAAGGINRGLIRGGLINNGLIQ